MSNGEKCHICMSSRGVSQHPSEYVKHILMDSMKGRMPLNDEKTQFLKKGYRLSNYSALPNEIYEMNISSTAMVLYAKLLSRAQLSVMKDFFDEDGKAYIFYTQEDLARELHISVSAVKNNMNELLRAGLLTKKRSNKSSANMIFVKVPTSSLNSHNSVCKQSENELVYRSKTVSATGRKETDNKYRNKQKLIPNYNYAEGESL